MWKKKKQIVDERIEKESNQLISKQFYVMVLMNVLAMVVKIACKLPFYLYLLEMITLLTMVLYVIIKETSQGILFIKSRDDSVQSIHEGVLAGAYHIAFNIVIAGELLFFVLVYGFAKEYLLWIISYFMIWVPSALWITIASMQKGWLIWGSRKREAAGKKNLGMRTVIGALFFGIIMTFFKVLERGSFQMSDIGMVFAMAAGWGIPFYLIFVLLMKASEKNADKIAEEKENNHEE